MAGFAIPAVLQTINGLNPYFPFIPRIYWGTQLSLFGDTVSIPLRLSFQMLGFSYFINKDIALGLVFFYLVNTVQQGIFNKLGLQEIDPILGTYSSYTGTISCTRASAPSSCSSSSACGRPAATCGMSSEKPSVAGRMHVK